MHITLRENEYTLYIDSYHEEYYTSLLFPALSQMLTYYLNISTLIFSLICTILFSAAKIDLENGPNQV